MNRVVPIHLLSFFWILFSTSVFTLFPLPLHPQDVEQAIAELEELSPKTYEESLNRERRLRILLLLRYRPPSQPLSPEFSRDPELSLLNFFFHRLLNPSLPPDPTALPSAFSSLFEDSTTMRVLQEFFLKGRVCGKDLDPLFCPRP